jgi:UDP-GlcNAc3NAcA epimerase
LRSFNRRMPEEVNRVMTDHLSRWSFAPSDGARRQLADEGITDGVHVVGDIMLDVVLQQRERARAQSRMPGALGLAPQAYALATIHRAENTDDRARLATVLESLGALELPVVLPLHPRTRHRIESFGLSMPAQVRLLEPMGYLDMLALMESARCVITDSGGVQKEAYYVGVPCVTLRDETEWTETVQAGWNVLCTATPEALRAAVLQMTSPRPPQRPLYGDGTTAEQIAVILAAA